MLKSIFAAVAGIWLWSSAAQADVVHHYTLSDIGSGHLMGSLDYDVTTSSFQSVHLFSPGLGAFFYDLVATYDIGNEVTLSLVDTVGVIGLNLSFGPRAALHPGAPLKIDPSPFNSYIFLTSNHLVLDSELSGTFTVASAVPEPTTWAMLLLGFAGLGFLGLRRSAAAAANSRYLIGPRGFDGALSVHRGLPAAVVSSMLFPGRAC